MRRAIPALILAIAVATPNVGHAAGLEVTGKLNANATEDLVFATGTTWTAREGSNAAVLWSGRPILSFIQRAQIRGDTRQELIQFKESHDPSVNCFADNTSATWSSRVRVRVLAPGTGDIAWDKTRTKVNSCTPTTFDAQLAPRSAKPMADVDGDGRGEIFVDTLGSGGTYGGASTVTAGGIVLAGLDGHVIASPHVECASCRPRMIAVPDLDGDGRADVLAMVNMLSTGTPTGQSTLTAMRIDGSTIWSVPIAAKSISMQGAYAFSTAGRKDLLLQTTVDSTQRSIAVKGSDGSTLWDRKHVVVMGDVDGDAVSDVLDWTDEATTFGHETARHLTALKSPSLSQIWSYDVVDPAVPDSREWIERPSSARRLNGDLLKDVLLAGYFYTESEDQLSGRNTALDGRTGRLMWQANIPQLFDPVVTPHDQFLDADLNGDHGWDIERNWRTQKDGVCTWGERFLSGKDRNELWRQSWSMKAKECLGITYQAADVDGDGRAEPILHLTWQTADGKNHGVYKALDPRGSLWTI